VRVIPGRLAPCERAESSGRQRSRRTRTRFASGLVLAICTDRSSLRGANMQSYTCDTVHSCSIIALARLAALYVNKNKYVFRTINVSFLFFKILLDTSSVQNSVLVTKLCSNPVVISSNHCLGRRGCRSVVTLNAYTTACCAELPPPKEFEARALHRDRH
jgi:hypothetical protein